VPIPVPWLESREQRAAAEAARRAEQQARAAEEEARRAEEAAAADEEKRASEVAGEPDTDDLPAAPDPRLGTAAAEPSDPAAVRAFEAAEVDGPPVDGGDEASILPRLQNSEDS